MRQITRSLIASSALVVAGFTCSASAADLGLRAPITKGPIVAPVSHWGGFYVSASAGGTWTRADYTKTSNTPFTNTSSDGFLTGFCPPPGGGPFPVDDVLCTRTTTSVTNGLETFGETSTGSDKGAVFTFTAGYNFVWNSWLLGAQSEVSYNLTKVFLQGSGNLTSASVNVRQTSFSSGFVEPPTTTFFNDAQTFAVTHELRHNWTVSEMAKIGFLATPELLVYGLVGWSWGGFDIVDESKPYTLNGFTYGGGIERDFGWLRGFIQVKAINYREKSLITSNGFTETSTSANTVGGTNINTTTRGGATDSRLRANVTTITAGVTVPLNFWH